MLQTVFLLQFCVPVLISHTSLLRSLGIRLCSITVLRQLLFSLFPCYLLSDFSLIPQLFQLLRSFIFSACFLGVLFNGNELLTSCFLQFMFSQPSYGLPRYLIFFFEDEQFKKHNMNIYFCHCDREKPNASLHHFLLKAFFNSEHFTY